MDNPNSNANHAKSPRKLMQGIVLGLVVIAIMGTVMQIGGDKAAQNTSTLGDVSAGFPSISDAQPTLTQSSANSATTKIMSLPGKSKLINVASDGGNTFTCICCPRRLDVTSDSMNSYHCPTNMRPALATNRARFCQEVEMGGSMTGGKKALTPIHLNPGGQCTRACLNSPNCVCGKINPADGQCYLFDDEARCETGGNYLGGKCAMVCVPQMQPQKKVQEVCGGGIACAARCNEISSNLKALTVSIPAYDSAPLTVCAVALGKDSRGFRVGSNEVSRGNVCVYGYRAKEEYAHEYKCLCLEKSVTPEFVSTVDGESFRKKNCKDMCAVKGKAPVATGTDVDDAYVCVWKSSRDPQSATFPGSNLKGEDVCKISYDGVEQAHAEFYCVCV